MLPRSSFEELADQARRRYIFNLVLAQGVFATGVTMVGVILLLVAGTELLDWPWLVLFFAASFGWGMIRAMRRFPGPYRVLQQVDHRLKLQDALSTAFFFREPAGPRRTSEEVRLAQQRRAEKLSREIDLRRAVPVAAPRALHATAALAVVAIALLGVRYGFSRTLDLRPPIARPTFDLFREAAFQQAVLPDEPLRQRLPEASRPEAFPAEGGEPGESNTTANSPADAPAASEASDESALARRASPSEGPESLREAEENADSSGEAAGPDASASSESGSEQQAADRRQPPSSGENSGLLDKLRDAMADLLAKLKIQPPMTGAREVASTSQSPGGRPTPSQKGMPGQGKQQGENAEGEGEPSDQPGEGAESSQAARGQSGDTASGQKAGDREKSGVGKEEGDKDVKEAEQLAAMGKISEIFGKRAQNVTGEVTVEVTSAKRQQLKTPYSQRAADHADTGAEIHRDEIPLIYQHYVQRYFEEVRKSK